MSLNLDRSLDEIIAARSRTNRRSGNKAAVAGGIRKRHQKATAQKAHTSWHYTKVSTSKIIVSNLPYDVSEQMIKDYFRSVVGPVRRAILTYGPDGRFRGVATAEFTKPEHAATAAQKCNGAEVGKRRMKVELVVNFNARVNFAGHVRAANTNSTPNASKARAVAKSGVEPGATRRRAETRGRNHGGNAGSGRGKPKTTQELDQEIADCFSGLGMNDTDLVGTP